MTHPWCHFGPIRDQADIAALEAVPLDQRVGDWDIAAWLRRGRQADPDKIALTTYPAGDPADTPTTLSYASLEAQTNRIANLFHTLGVTSRDTIALLAPTSPEIYPILMAALATGILCPINAALGAGHVADLIAAAGAKLVISAMPHDHATHSIADLLAEAEHHPADRITIATAREADDVVAYVHSGGTSGAPKLVRITSRGMVHKCWSVTQTMAHRPDDILFSDMPMFHIAGLISCGILPIVLGASLVIPTPLGARDKIFIANYWKFVERCRISFLHAVPTTLGTLAQNPPTTENISSLRDYATTGSTALPLDVARTIHERLGIRLLMTYGSTEFCQNATQAPRDGDPRFGAAGLRNPDTEIRIVRRDRSGAILLDCAVNQIGNVLVRSPGNTPGYVDATHDKTIFVEGWIDNGDLGRLDENGYLWLTGRAKDLIIRGGHNIDPSMIEAALCRHPAVAAAAAVGKPDSYAGELPVAYVQLVAGANATEAELKEFARAEVSERAAAPADIFIVGSLLLTDVGKVAKNHLRHDAIRRTFETLLQDRHDVEATVAVSEHDTHGIVATISLPRAIPGIETTLGAFTVRTILKVVA